MELYFHFELSEDKLGLSLVSGKLSQVKWDTGYALAGLALPLLMVVVSGKLKPLPSPLSLLFMLWLPNGLGCLSYARYVGRKLSLKMCAMFPIIFPGVRVTCTSS